MSSSDKKFVMQYNSDYEGCGFWRLLWPQFVLNLSGLAQVHHSHLFIRDFVHYARVSAIHIQRQTTPAQYQFFQKLAHLRDRLGFRIIYDIDDIIFREDIPLFNEARKHAVRDEVRESQQKIIELCDEMTVSTPFLREYFLKKTSQKNITVLPNYQPLLWMGNLYSEEFILNNYRKNKERPRILYAGSTSHFDTEGLTRDERDDFYHVRDAIIESRKEFKWIFVGACPLSVIPYIQSGEIEYYPWKNLQEYPSFLSSLGANMAVAPLMENDFNRGKSDIKYLEASALGLPIACQDLCTYSVAPIRFKSGEEMIEQLRRTLQSEESLLEAARTARKAIDHRWLENKENIGKYLDVYSFPYGDRRRQFL